MSTSRPTRYTCEIVFHRATNVPVADLHNFSCDPYISATLRPLQNGAGGSGPAASAQPESESLLFRTATARRTLNPIYDARWIVSGVPASGFSLAIKLLDEDPGNRDDRLGKAEMRFPDPNLDPAYGSELRDGWHTGEREYKVHKWHGSVRTRLGTYVASVVTRGRVGHRVRVVVSVRVLGEAPCLDGEDGQRVYTLGPHIFVRHFSPLATRLTYVQSFKANRLQLTGPVPSSLRHRYVGFAPFIKAMFRKRGIEGIILNRILHKQHHAIYKWDKNTVWGVVDGADTEVDEDHNHVDGKDAHAHDTAEEGRPDEAFAKKFLEMAEYGTEGRIYTYVILLDGQLRFTETGEEFAIGLLSKHTMHANVAIEIAYSGEFFVRRVRQPHHARAKPEEDGHANGNTTHHDSDKLDRGDEPAPADADNSDPSSLPPSAYELVIDNDSGTYRPRKDLLPVLGEYLSRPSNLGALGRIRVMDGFDDKLKRWKEQRKEEKKRARGGKAAIVRQASISSSGSSSSSSSSSSSDEEAIAAAAKDAEKERQRGHKDEGNEDEEKVLKEDAERAKANEDDDAAAQQEEQGAQGSKPDGAGM
ncbi:hypothetical protein L226DRAFT_599989 [Lentinus tigrinus ALCF2SS1-7]|uniref:uncharacterized protein n=1 Tax=Lentinus tigrinus ALCF2SS1-7 TaxID=1328758 RepID=UPI001165E8AF|nr:hypothetical protein L226DRAFT_599989 [Lentinus tigrinus ALCF2SS1-7]